MDKEVLGGDVEPMRRLHPDAPFPPVCVADAIVEDARRKRTELGDDVFGVLSEGGEGDEWGEHGVPGSPGAPRRLTLLLHAGLSRRSEGTLLAWFPDDRACLDYLDWLRWPDGLCCPLCAGVVAWRLSDGRWSCGGCRRRLSPTTGITLPPSLDAMPLETSWEGERPRRCGKRPLEAKIVAHPQRGPVQRRVGIRGRASRAKGRCALSQGRETPRRARSRDLAPRSARCGHHLARECPRSPRPVGPWPGHRSEPTRRSAC